MGRTIHAVVVMAVLCAACAGSDGVNVADPTEDDRAAAETVEAEPSPADVGAGNSTDASAEPAADVDEPADPLDANNPAWACDDIAANLAIAGEEMRVTNVSDITDSSQPAIRSCAIALEGDAAPDYPLEPGAQVVIEFSRRSEPTAFRSEAEQAARDNALGASYENVDAAYRSFWNAGLGTVTLIERGDLVVLVTDPANVVSAELIDRFVAGIPARSMNADGRRWDCDTLVRMSTAHLGLTATGTPIDTEFAETTQVGGCALDYGSANILFEVHRTSSRPSLAWSVVAPDNETDRARWALATDADEAYLVRGAGDPQLAVRQGDLEVITSTGLAGGATGSHPFDGPGVEAFVNDLVAGVASGPPPADDESVPGPADRSAFSECPSIAEVLGGGWDLTCVYLGDGSFTMNATWEGPGDQTVFGLSALCATAEAAASNGSPPRVGVPFDQLVNNDEIGARYEFHDPDWPGLAGCDMSLSDTSATLVPDPTSLIRQTARALLDDLALLLERSVALSSATPPPEPPNGWTDSFGTTTSEMTFEQAGAYCAALDLAGFVPDSRYDRAIEEESANGNDVAVLCHGGSGVLYVVVAAEPGSEQALAVQFDAATLDTL